MAIKRSVMADTTATVEVEWYGETAQVTVRPGRLTRELFAMMDEERSFDALAEQVKQLVVSWEVVDDEGKELPVDDTTIATLPFGFIRAIVFAAVQTVDQQGKA
jgi:hypothetical protein